MKCAVTCYRALLMAYLSIVFGPLLFEIGVSYPAYTFDAKTWLTGIGVCALPTWLGYLMGRAAERASSGEKNK